MAAETLHATSVAIGGRAVLLLGAPGTGKSDLALRLIDRGASLISDDITLVEARGDTAIARAPATILGQIEVRGLGIVPIPPMAEAPVALAIVLDTPPERMPPEPLPTRAVAGAAIPILALDPFEASAPIKVERALILFGLPS